MTLKWLGPAVSERLRQAQIQGVNATLAAAVNRAKRNHDWQNRTGTLEGSIGVLDFARAEGRGVRGNWGSRDVRYALIQELGGTIVPRRAKALVFEIGGEVDFVGDRKVIATCDQTGYYLAYRMMAEMYAALNDEENSKKYSTQAEELKRRTNELLWDGVKYQHHVHITPLEHPGFDESQQLASSNTWSMTRGLAELDQAVSIIDEYKRRHEETGDALPWWSLQPGYPDELGYWPGSPCCVQ
ncbi:hypothetical protein LCGC14_2730940, partial [marine sediment metagenome]